MIIQSHQKILISMLKIVALGGKNSGGKKQERNRDYFSSKC